MLTIHVHHKFSMTEKSFLEIVSQENVSDSEIALLWNFSLEAKNELPRQ